LGKKKCVQCGSLISVSDTVCPYCGAVKLTDTSKNIYAAETGTKKHKNSYLDGRSYMLEDEELVSTFMPDKAFKRRPFRSAFLASFISLFILTGFGILTKSNGSAILSTLNIIFAILVLIDIFKLMDNNKVFSIIYVITKKRVIIPQVRKKNGPTIMRIPDVSSAFIIKTGRIKSESEKQQYLLTFMPRGYPFASDLSNSPVSLSYLNTSMRKTGRQVPLRLLVKNSFRYMSLDEAQKALSMFNLLKQPATEKVAN